MGAKMIDYSIYQIRGCEMINWCIRCIALGVLLGSSINSVTAAELYKWVDEFGNVTYQDSPPSSSVSFEEQIYTDPNQTLQESVALEIEEAGNNSPVTLFTVPICDACDLVRFYLEQNSIPFTEKNIQNNVTLQQELKALADALRVPTLVVGDVVIDGYSKSAMRSTLIENGYPIEQIEAGVSPEDDTEDDQLQDEEGTENPEDFISEESTELQSLDEQAIAEILEEPEFDFLPESEAEPEMQVETQ
jgi:arsenate reductase-like glutaredoxin family protein